MKLIIYDPVKADMNACVEFWAARYRDYDDECYHANVGQELTEKRILDLFEWKNRTPLSEPKRISVIKNFVARRGELEQITALLVRFSDGVVTWRIFWLHCWQPARFPVYDQHLHRAMRFIEEGVLEEIPKCDDDKIRSYIDRYIPFHARFNGLPHRSVNKVLWDFGNSSEKTTFPMRWRGRRADDRLGCGHPVRQIE